MNSSFSSKRKIKSLDTNRSMKLKKELKKKSNMSKTVLYKISPINKDIIKEDNNKEEISLLSNANLKIIKILNSFANDDILNESSFIVSNSNEDAKEKSVESITKWKNRLCAFKGSPKNKNKKSKPKSNNSLFLLNSNYTDLNSDFTDKKTESFKSKKAMLSNEKRSGKDVKTNENNKPKKRKGEGKHSSDINKRHYNNNQMINDRQRSKSIVFSDTNFFISRFGTYNNIQNTNKNKNNMNQTEIENENNYKGFLSEIEIMKINENIHNDINFIQLKKKISKLKKTIQTKSSKKDFSKFKFDKNSNSPKPTPINRISTIIEHNEEALTSKNIDSNIQNVDEHKLLNNKLNMSSNNKKKKKEKFRILMKKKDVYDSFDDEEYKEEEIDYYISPFSWYIKIFDLLIFFSSVIYFIFIPYFLSKNNFNLKEHQIWKIIFLIIDILYIIDIIINFFRAYENFDEHLVRKTKKIFFHYLRTWFLLDLIQAIPYFSIIKFLENYLNNNANSLSNISFNGYNVINEKIYIILLVKIIKLYKMLNNNSTLSYFSEILSKNEILDDNGTFIINILIIVLILNMTTCLFIFIGINSYPGWIIELNIQDQSYLYIYLTSVYFVIVTITTVGYGDITGKTFSELIFQICLLIIGTIAYSFTISYISNNIIKANQKSMTYEKNLEILQEIKLHHPNMKNTLYNEVLRNLYNEQLYERKDKHLLFDCLPYSLKNKLIMEMYRPLIKHFVFFKDIDNSDFIVKVATSLKPLISIKNDILIQEGDYIKEIIFVKKGVIGLNMCIDLGDPESSLKKYFFEKKIGKFDISYMRSNIIKMKKSFINNNINLFLKGENNIDSIYSEENIEHIKIIEIRNNEHFGDALMFLNERCPLVAKVRTKTAEILILRKIEAIEIYSIYPNIWKRINKKSLYNMEQIYLKIKKIVIELSHRYNLNIDELLNKKKPRFSLKRSVTINRNEEENQIEEKKNEQQEKEDIIKEKEFIEQKKKIEELNENLNTNYGLNIISNMSMNMIENMTKKSTTQKESILSFENSKNNFEKNILFKNTKVSINPKINNETFNKSKTTRKDYRNSIHTRKSLIKFNSIKTNKTREKESNTGTQKYSNKHSSISPIGYYTHNLKYNNDSNNSNSNLSSRLNKVYKKTYSKNEKLFYNIFTNLSTTKEKSFQLNSSYDNINYISNNKYIKDINLQSKIKQIIIKECTDYTRLKKKSTFLIPPVNLSITYKSPKMSNKSNAKKFNDILSEAEFYKYDICHSENSNNKKNILNKSMTLKTKHNEDDNIKKNLKDQFRSSGKLIEVHSNHRFIKKNRFPCTDTRKSKRKTSKKKPEKIDKQLNIISKNIESSSKNINHPEEFYMNFFTNIIAKESRSINGDENNKNILDFNSGELNDMNTNRKDNNQLNLFDSFISNKDSSIKDSNLNIIKIRHKSGFNSKA